MITKKELVDALSQYPDDMEVYINATSDYTVPSGEYDIIHVSRVRKLVNDFDERDFIEIEVYEN